ncbi:hypothetical protein RhiirA1_400254 [Rhizophagus irregularis]|uniref:Uncharacterized protein n=1 Tax=Rhizophagus irregularis TaxID=588596 RepID=A0A2N0R6U0_9GLOM|nr:hypothetical protein RhiirA1_400254 [Rhizophagus irregularis]
MLAIEKFLKEEDLKLDILKHSELENIKEEKGKIRKLLELMKKENFETYEINVMDEALTINEFNLFWKYKRMTTRIWVKRCDEVAEIEKDRGIDLKKEKKNRGGR